MNRETMPGWFWGLYLIAIVAIMALWTIAATGCTTTSTTQRLAAGVASAVAEHNEPSAGQCSLLYHNESPFVVVITARPNKTTIEKLDVEALNKVAQ